MAENGENYTCGILLVITYVKTVKDGLHLKENSPLWHVFCALVPCGGSEVIFCLQPGALSCMEENRKNLGRRNCKAGLANVFDVACPNCPYIR